MSTPVQHAHDLRPMAVAPDAPISYRGWLFQENPATRIWKGTKNGFKALFAAHSNRLARLVDAAEALAVQHG